ncbi:MULTISPECIES: TetR family transcriptional regulator [Curtobacterium]|uniref:TetR/AcrR family transcriptional regulator n=1 Tax=Curtobacterium flaccumfaciens TaxID=2035 RepID=UPI00310C54B1
MTTTERTRALRRRMIVEARRATVEHGLHGFTIEQLCETVGVSRRTFFNHFASKDDAVLGIEQGASEALLHDFATRTVVPEDLDPLAAVVALAIEQVHLVGLDRTEQDLARRVFEHEPAMVPKFLAVVDEQLAAVARAVRARFGWDDPADRRAQLVAETAGTLLKVTAATYFDDAYDEATSPPFEALLTDNLRQLRAAITTTGQDPTA